MGLRPFQVMLEHADGLQVLAQFSLLQVPKSGLHLFVLDQQMLNLLAERPDSGLRLIELSVFGVKERIFIFDIAGKSRQLLSQAFTLRSAVLVLFNCDSVLLVEFD